MACKLGENMAITITNTAMTSDITGHTARYLDDAPNSHGPGAPWGWSVSWFPEHAMTRNEAITAMTLAESVVTHADELKDRTSAYYGHFGSWCAELGLTRKEVIDSIVIDSM